MMISRIKNFEKKILLIIQTILKYSNYHKKIMIQNLQNQKHYQNTKCLVPYGYKVYSKNEEDGIISEIFNRIGTTNKIFVEFGAGNGLENNTLALLFQNWMGLWIEGSQKYVQQIQQGFQKTIGSGQLNVIQAFITRDNINSLISESIQENVIDLLSVDLDGNDYHIFNSIDCIQPRVLVVEYNAKFPPPIMYCMEYNEKHLWDGSDNFGASLKFLEIHLREKGYSLVGCNLTGGNAFFVQTELVKDLFYTPYTAENHYEPARYELANYTSGHRPSYNSLENRLH